MAATAVVFDLDGTLWDGHRFYAGVISLAGGDFARSIRDLKAGSPAAAAIREAGITRAAFRGMVHSGKCASPLYPDTQNVLGQLKMRGIPMGVATSLPEWIAGPILEWTGLRSMFGVVVDWGKCRNHKPSPEPILTALEALHVDNDPGVWYVGDSEKDAQCAKSAGVSFAWASYGYGSKEPAGTDTVLASPGDLLDL